MPVKERGFGIPAEVQFGPDAWKVDSATGTLSLSEEALAQVLNPEPLEKWYDVDPEPIARGQFAVVYHCTHRTSGVPYAAKFAHKKRMGADATATIIHEIAVNVILNASHINVQLNDVFETRTDYVLIMEFAGGGDLQSVLDAEIVPYEENAVDFVKQVLKGLVTMHTSSIAHLDIKPQNLVLMGEYPDCKVKLVDFEISRYIDPKDEIVDFLGTPDYVAPEILCLDPITTKTDMWSVGVLSYVLLCGFLPFDGNSDQQTFLEILRGEITFPNELFEDISTEAIDFIKKLLIREPENRMSARECLGHPWMTKIFRPSEEAKTPLPPHPVMRAESSPSMIDGPRSEQEVPSVRSHSIGESTANSSATIKPNYHPKAAQKSMSVALELGSTSSTKPLPGFTPFLNKESRFMGSRQNLDKLKTMSKSREVLYERVQMNNVKKTLSKSRERVHDPKISVSRQDLLKCKNLSQSIEALSALSNIHNSELFHNRVSNPRLAKIKERMYRSMVSIDNIVKSDNPNKNSCFISQVNIDNSFNDLVTIRNTNLNTIITDSLPMNMSNATKLGGLRANPCKGGRSADCGQLDEASETKTRSATENCNTNKSERMKKDAQRRKKERKEREEKHRKYSLGHYETKRTDLRKNSSTVSPKLRRGSVSHVEQRLQERHEKQGQLAKLAISECRNRLSSTDSERSLVDRSPRSPRAKVPSQTGEKPARVSVTRQRRRSSKLESLTNSDTSQSSSMESVLGSTENIKSFNKKPKVEVKPIKRTRRIGQYTRSVTKKIDDIAEVSDEAAQSASERVNPNSNINTDTNDTTKPMSDLPKVVGVVLKGTPTVNVDSSGNDLTETSPLQSEMLSEMNSTNLLQVKSLLKRSISITSDLGSSLSESMDETDDSKFVKCRCRSKSIGQQTPVSAPITRSRSKSVVHQDSDAKPWGDICSGSVAKALRNFTNNDDGFSVNVKNSSLKPTTVS